MEQSGLNKLVESPRLSTKFVELATGMTRVVELLGRKWFVNLSGLKR